MAEGGREAVRSVELARHIGLGNLEVALQHARDLLLGGRTAARDGLLDTHRDVLGDREVTRQRRGHSYALRTAELEHTLDVLPEEGGFDGELIGVELIHEREHTVVDPLEAQVVILVLVELDDAHGQQPRLLPTHHDQAVAHHDGTWVDAHDNAFVLGHQCIRGEVVSSREKPLQLLLGRFIPLDQLSVLKILILPGIFQNFG